MKKRIFLSPPHMSGKELQYIEEVFASNYIAPVGSFLDRFEAQVQEQTQAEYALALHSGTAAIHLALRVLGIGKGDDVLVSTFTFIGSVSPLLYQGANPVFIDSDQKSWNLDPKLLNKYLLEATKKPKALIVTHLYGQMADIEKIAAICKLHGVYLIEDAAESLGAHYKGQASGTFGDFGIYSFNGNKILTTSGGGMLVCHKKEWYEKALFYSTAAKEQAPHYEHKEYGYNYRMSNVLAAIGVGQMEVLEERVQQKRAIFEDYKSLLSAYSLEWMPELPHSYGNRWLTTLLLPQGCSVYRLVDALAEQGCEARPLWKPMHLQKLFEDVPVVGGRVSEALFERGICLPSGTAMEYEDICFITTIIKRVLDACTHK